MLTEEQWGRLKLALQGRAGDVFGVGGRDGFTVRRSLEDSPGEEGFELVCIQLRPESKMTGRQIQISLISAAWNEYIFPQEVLSHLTLRAFKQKPENILVDIP